MNKSNVILALGLVPMLVACASTGQVTVLEPVGPTPLRATAPKPESDGTLKVYSLRGIQTAEGVNYHPHTDYTLVSSANQRKEIHNAGHQYGEEPVAVFLPAGAYLETFQREHAAICESILAGDAERARDAMRRHLGNSQARYRRLAAEAAGSAGGKKQA
jgi:hypothetical protein